MKCDNNLHHTGNEYYHFGATQHAYIQKSLYLEINL